MITVGIIRNGSSYLSNHLRKNDYWQEGESEVVGQWIGEGARLLGLEGAVTDKPFEALRRNLHPATGERLTARQNKTRMAFFDIQLSAPKDGSVLAMVGGDERVREAFRESVQVTLQEMERWAAVRERRGDARNSESFRLTGNFTAALFLHDASRDLDPQLHVHAVIANTTWDADQNKWMALQHAEMMRASPYLRQVLYRELAGRLHQLGYETHEMSSTGFSIRGVETLRERFSKRARQVQKLAEQFAGEKGRRATKREIEVIVRESRQEKLREVTTTKVRHEQQQQLNPEERTSLAVLVSRARSLPPRQHPSHALTTSILESALRHVYERSSVAREGEVLNAALALHPDFFNWRELRETLAAHPNAIRHEGEMTLRSIFQEESATVQRVRDGRNTRMQLGSSESLDPKLTPGQHHAAAALLGNRDFVAVLVGDAGTGKTTVLTALEFAHLAAGGQRFVALAPTTRAREALVNSGFEYADTVQKFLVDESLQRAASRRVLLIDEAGLLSTQQLNELTRIAEEVRARLLLVGDTKQHYSVQRGDALRNVIRQTELPIVRLAEVLRQRTETDRRFSQLLASGDPFEAFSYAERRGMIHESGDDQTLFLKAADHYAKNLSRGIDTLVVIPFWEEIERFNTPARAALRRAGILGEAELIREAVKPLSWTDEQKANWDQYRPGDRLLFVRDTRFIKRGTSAEVIETLKDGLTVRGKGNRVVKVTRRQRGTFEVGRAEKLPIAKGDRLLIRGREDTQKLSNGDLKTVAQIDPETNRVVFTDGSTLPENFHAWTYAHAVTSYRAQGSTSEESMLVLGEVAERALTHRQFYVGNTRYRGAHRIYVSHPAEILQRLALPGSGRELATEFLQRHGLRETESLSLSMIQRASARIKTTWRSVMNHWHGQEQTVHRKMGI